MDITSLHITKYRDGEIICTRFKNDKKKKSFCGNKVEFLKWIQETI